MGLICQHFFFGIGPVLFDYLPNNTSSLDLISIINNDNDMTLIKIKIAKQSDDLTKFCFQVETS